MRPIDQHLAGLEALGATVELEHGYVTARAPRLSGGRFRFDVRTVGGTENPLMAATLARGITALDNCAGQGNEVSHRRLDGITDQHLASAKAAQIFHAAHAPHAAGEGTDQSLPLRVGEDSFFPCEDLRIAIEDDCLYTVTRKYVGGTQPGRPGADDGNAFIGRFYV